MSSLHREPPLSQGSELCVRLSEGPSRIVRQSSLPHFPWQACGCDEVPFDCSELRVSGEVAPAPVPQDDRSLSFQCCTAGVRKVAQKPLAALIQRLGSQGEGPVGIGDLVRVPSATVSELGSGTVLDLDDARDLSIGKVVEVNDHRFLPLCILFPNGVLRWYADSSVRRAMLSHSQEMQVRRAISSLEDRAVMSEQGPVIDAQVRKSVPKGPEHHEPPLRDCIDWAESELRTWRRSHHRCRSISGKTRSRKFPTEEAKEYLHYSDEFIEDACNATGLNFHEMAVVQEPAPSSGPLDNLPSTDREWAALYAELSLPSGVAFDVIRRSFGVLAWRRHPDRGGSSEELDRLFCAYDAFSRRDGVNAPVKPLDAPRTGRNPIREEDLIDLA